MFKSLNFYLGRFIALSFLLSFTLVPLKGQ